MVVAVINRHDSSQSFQNFLSSEKQDKRFQQILLWLFFVYLIIAIGVPLIEKIEVPREIKERVPPQLAKIMLKEKQLPLPEKPKEIKPPEVKKTEPQLEETIVPSQSTREEAKEKAQTSGLAAMKDELFSMREAFVIEPSEHKELTKNDTQEVKIQRNLLVSEVHKQSNSLSTLSTKQTVKSGELSTKGTQHIRLAEEEILAVNALTEESSIGSSTSSRSEASLRSTLESSKARLYALYNRALRRDPFLKGKVMFEIEIQPNGKVSNVLIKTSELKNKKLERQLTVILRSILFLEEPVDVMKTIWSIDFIPS